MSVRALRIDLALVERGLFPSRAKAAEAIAAGLVMVDGRTVAKASETLPDTAEIDARAPYPWVSRGGVKLVAALDAFGIVARDRICLDVGASTGGFTDVLLARGARHVTAVDVGTGQLHPRLGADPRVISLEKTDARNLTPAILDPAPSLVVVDVSFISLRLVLPAVVALVAPHAELIALVKPQFEVGPGRVRKGLVRDPGDRARACECIAACVRMLGWSVRGIVASPISGGDGNVEFLLAAQNGAG